MKWPSWHKKIPYFTLLFGPTISLYTGLALNKLCIAANGGTMPYLTPSCVLDSDHLHVCMTGLSHLKILADWIVLPAGTFSIGDMLIDLGTGTAAYAWIIWAVLMIKHYNDTQTGQ
jgi:hypothetical protein